MKNSIALFLILIIPFVLTSCAKTPVKRQPTIPVEEIKGLYDYTDKDVLSQERITDNKVMYLNQPEFLVEEAIKEIRNEMEKQHNVYVSGKTEYANDELFKQEQKFLGGEGYYISTVPVTMYNNNINMLWDCFVLYIFNEDMEITGRAYIKELNSRKLNVGVNSLWKMDIINAAQKAPDREFIVINTLGLVLNDSRMEYIRLLGEDNKIYDYNQYMDKGIIEDTVSKCDGDVFHALPEEMRFSYNELCDKENLRWIEFEKE